MKITFEDKEDKRLNPALRKNKVIGADLNEIKNSVNYLYDVNGWSEYKDTQHTSISPQDISANQETLITINAGSVIDEQEPLDDGLWFDNGLRPIKRGDGYLLRVDFSAKIVNSDGFFDMGLFVGGSVGFAFQNTFRFPKGNNVAHKFSFTQFIYTLDTFVTNGGFLKVTSSHNMSMWDKRVIICKIHDGR